MTKGHRIRGAISGIVFGLGIAVLLQQFAIVALDLAVVVALPLGMCLLGVGLGWPRRTPAVAPGGAGTPA